jgi:hypothetical protein
MYFLRFFNSKHLMDWTHNCCNSIIKYSKTIHYLHLQNLLFTIIRLTIKMAHNLYLSCLLIRLKIHLLLINLEPTKLDLLHQWISQNTTIQQQEELIILLQLILLQIWILTIDHLIGKVLILLETSAKDGDHYVHLMKKILIILFGYLLCF